MESWMVVAVERCKFIWVEDEAGAALMCVSAEEEGTLSICMSDEVSPHCSRSWRGLRIEGGAIPTIGCASLSVSCAYGSNSRVLFELDNASCDDGEGTANSAGCC